MISFVMNLAHIITDKVRIKRPISLNYHSRDKTAFSCFISPPATCLYSTVISKLFHKKPLTMFITVIFSQSLSPSKDLPGFRKILPRASYFVLSKGCPSNHQLEGFQPEVSVDTLDPQFNGSLPSDSLTQEPQFPPPGLAGEVELSEQPIVVDNIVGEMAAVSSPTSLQGMPPSSSSTALSSISSRAPASTDVSQVLLKGNETKLARSGYCGTMVQQIQGETAQVVAIIPAQVRLKYPSTSRMTT